MKNEDFKIINERWDRYVKESETLDEIDRDTLKKAGKIGAGAAAGGLGLATADAFSSDIYRLLINIMTNPTTDLLRYYWSVVGEVAGGISIVKSSFWGAIIGLVVKAIGEKKSKAMFEQVDAAFQELLSSNPDKAKSINSANMLVKQAYKYILKQTFFSLSPEKIKKELDQETGDRGQNFLESIQELILQYLNLSFFKNSEGGVNVYIAANFADKELRNKLFEFVLSHPPNKIQAYLTKISNYNAKTGALQYEAPPPTPEKDPEGGKEQPSRLAIPSGDDIKKFG